jgi:hypothetical protein
MQQISAKAEEFVWRMRPVQPKELIILTAEVMTELTTVRRLAA